MHELELDPVGPHALDLGQRGHGVHAVRVGGHDDDLGRRERLVGDLGQVAEGGGAGGREVVREQGHADPGEQGVLVRAGAGLLGVEHLRAGKDGEVYGGWVGLGPGHAGRGVEALHQGDHAVGVRGRGDHGAVVGCYCALWFGARGVSAIELCRYMVDRY